MCMKQRQLIDHTIICGRRLKFTGNPRELLLSWIFEYILTIITFGLFFFVVKVKFKHWVIQNTVFDHTDIPILNKYSSKDETL